MCRVLKRGEIKIFFIYLFLMRESKMWLMWPLHQLIDQFSHEKTCCKTMFKYNMGENVKLAI